MTTTQSEHLRAAMLVARVLAKQKTPSRSAVTVWAYHMKMMLAKG